MPSLRETFTHTRSSRPCLWAASAAVALLWGCSEPAPPEDHPDSIERISLVPVTDALELPPSHVYGISLADFDDDGLADVNLATIEGLFVFHNEGDWSFRDVRQELGLVGAAAPDLHHSHSVIWVDVDDDGDLDLFIGRRLLPQNSGPGIDALLAPALLRNDAGLLVDVTSAAGLDRDGSWEGAAFSDFVA